MAKQQGFYIGKVEGKAEVLAALDNLKPALYKELVVRMEDEAKAIADDINRAMPNTAPLSGFDHAGPTSWANKGSASPKSAGMVDTEQGDWPVYKISLGGYASAVCDIAGAGSRGVTEQGTAMIAMLNSRVGRASRWVWPVGKRHTRQIERKMEAACDKVGDQMSARLKVGT